MNHADEIKSQRGNPTPTELQAIQIALIKYLTLTSASQKSTRDSWGITNQFLQKTGNPTTGKTLTSFVNASINFTN